MLPRSRRPVVGMSRHRAVHNMLRHEDFDDYEYDDEYDEYDE